MFLVLTGTSPEGAARTKGVASHAAGRSRAAAGISILTNEPAARSDNPAGTAAGAGTTPGDDQRVTARHATSKHTRVSAAAAAGKANEPAAGVAPSAAAGLPASAAIVPTIATRTSHYHGEGLPAGHVEVGAGKATRRAGCAGDALAASPRRGL